MKLVQVADIPTMAVDVPVDNLVSVLNVCLQMEDLCIRSDGVGLAAVQVGLPWRLFLVKVGDKFEYYVNCTYSPEGGDRFPSIEGCLSIRSEDGSLRYFQVERYRKIRVKGYKLVTRPDLKLEPVDFAVSEEFLSVVFQHEADHFFGRDRMIDVIGKEVAISSYGN